MDRPGIESSPSRMLSGCDATTPTAPELSRPRVLNYLPRTAFSAAASPFAACSAAAGCLTSRLSPICSKAIGPEQPQKLRFPRWSRPHSFVHSEHQPKGVRRQQGLFSSFLLPAHSFGWCSLWANECGLEQRGQRSFCSWPLSLDTSCSCWLRPGDR